jgi:hypothetical protein
MPDNPVIDQTTPADDLLFGVPAISAFVGRNERQVRYDIRRKLIPAGKWGEQYVASKARLRALFADITSGRAA